MAPGMPISKADLNKVIYLKFYYVFYCTTSFLEGLTVEKKKRLNNCWL